MDKKNRKWYLITGMLTALFVFLGGCQLDLGTQVPKDDNQKIEKSGNCFVDYKNYVVIGDDMVLMKNDPAHMEIINALSNPVMTRGLKLKGTSLWPNKTVTYRIVSTLSTAEQQLITDAFNTLSATCGISFVPSILGSTDYVYKINKVTGQTYGGMSTVGYTKDAWVNIQSWSLGTIVHEFMHGLGLEHEHQREDRLVTINTANIMPAYVYAFDVIPKLKNSATYSITYGAYDFDSLMHYPANAFSSNGLDTINANGNAIGQRSHLSSIDQSTLRTLYGNSTSSPSSWYNITSSRWHTWFCINNEVPAVGDVNGDGKDDIITFVPNGLVYVALSNGSTGFGNGVLWHSSFVTDASWIPVVGYFNTDNKADIAYFTRGTTGDVYVALSNGSTAFGTKSRWHDSFCYNSEIPLVGDFTGEGRDDIATFTRGDTGDVYVAVSNGSSAFTGTGSKWHDAFCFVTEIPRVGGVDGDNRDDIICFTRGTSADVYVALSNGSSAFTNTGVRYHENFCTVTEIPEVGDFNKDGKDDLVTFNRGSSADAYLAISTGFMFYGNNLKIHDWFCANSETPLVGDFDGDDRADLITFLKSTVSGDAIGDVYVGLNKAIIIR